MQIVSSSISLIKLGIISAVFILSACVPLPECSDQLLASGKVAGVDCSIPKNTDLTLPVETPPVVTPLVEIPPETDNANTPTVVTPKTGLQVIVKDADLRFGLSNVNVTITKACPNGQSCSSPQLIQGKTNALGVYFDVQTSDLVPSFDSEALTIELSRAGYSPITKYLLPKYNDQGVAILNEIFMCQSTSADSDGDTMCNAAEEMYGTNVLERDTDGDALSDTAEIYGDSGIDLPAYGALPLRKNIFLEFDTHVHRVYSRSNIALLKRAFFDAPNVNIDGSTGIDLYIDNSEVLPVNVINLTEFENSFTDINVSFWGMFDEKIKSKHFNVRRQGIFHYGVGLPSLPKKTFGGISRGIVSDDFISNNDNIATVMHELGHNLGLTHGGGLYNRNFAPNYFSVMNYLYPAGYFTTKNTSSVLDYSRVNVDGFSESAFNEVQGFNAVESESEEELELYRVVTQAHGFTNFSAKANIDMNNDGQLGNNVVINVDNNSVTDNWNSAQNDWENLQYRGGRFSGDSYMAPLVSSLALSRSFSHSPEEPCPAY